MNLNPNVCSYTRSIPGQMDTVLQISVASEVFCFIKKQTFFFPPFILKDAIFTRRKKGKESVLTPNSSELIQQIKLMKFGEGACPISGEQLIHLIVCLH